MKTIDLRAARSTDAGKVGGILSEFIDHTDWMPRVHTRAEDVGFAGDLIEKDWVTVAQDANEVTGFIACDGETVQALYVTAAARQQGVGTALLNHAQNHRDALTLWTFQANVEAKAFYAAHGFVVVEETDGARNDEGLPDLRLEWKRETV
ncbi:GNAT family N-acetyltransferase [Tateyamaria pelophila]|uniref:GNAT family N-acetyltransferase n=1 Tax=Tateyamaria pelophila TaxID=328415 RepID=UPI001CBF30CE|nr:GNAT family N-acetyltransferase [Tateyamaria pelophila]